MANNTQRQTHSIVRLVKKMYRLASDPQNEDVISFGPNGLGIFIKNKFSFVRNVMRLHFRAKNFASIVRQLNSYGFQGNVQKDRKLLFSHPFFIKDSPHELHKIKKKPKRQTTGQRAPIFPARQSLAFKETADASQKPQSSIPIGLS